MKRGRRAVRPAPLLALLLAAAAAAAAPPAAQPSALWGEAGELWDPETGPMDFSFAGACPCSRRRWHSVVAGAGAGPIAPARARAARSSPSPAAARGGAPNSSSARAAGYHFGDEEPPFPPVTRTLQDFQTGGRNDTAALQAMVAWANAQPSGAGAAPAARLCWMDPAARVLFLA